LKEVTPFFVLVAEPVAARADPMGMDPPVGGTFHFSFFTRSRHSSFTRALSPPTDLLH